MDRTNQRITQIEQITGYNFNSKLRCIESIQMANEVTPAVIDGVFCQVEKNTRLAIVGDIVMNLVLGTMWYKHRNNQGIQHLRGFRDRF